VADGLLFFDSNFNGVLDDGEPFTVSYDDGSAALLIDFDTFDTNQNGALDDTEGQQVAIGGYSPYTGLVSDMTFVAPGDSFGINPFTTLVSQMMKDGKDQAEAIQLVNQSLGLPEDLDVGSFIPELALEDGDAALAAKFEAIQSQVHTAIVQISKLLDGASALSDEAIAPKVIQAMTAQILAGTPINLGSAADIQKLLTASIEAIKAADPALNTAALAAIASSVAQVIAESNQNIAKASQVSPAEVLRSIGLTQRVVLGEIAKDLEAVGAGKKSIQSVLAESTGTGFTKLLAAAKKEMTKGSNRGDILRGTRKVDVLRGQGGDDSIFGDQGNDRLFGDADADELKGQEGNDLLEGGLGNDTLIGDSGRDRLIGGDGNDSLAGDSGKDILIGGKGRDRFDIGINKADADRISDFSPREDLLVIGGLSVIKGFRAGKAVKSKFLEVGKKAGDRNDYLVYNPSTGALFYDENGSAKGLQTKIVQLSPGLDLRANNLVIA
jgi:Ca2+-binding RTX toxin-like protein